MSDSLEAWHAGCLPRLSRWHALYGKVEYTGHVERYSASLGPLVQIFISHSPSSRFQLMPSKAQETTKNEPTTYPPATQWQLFDFPSVLTVQDRCPDLARSNSTPAISE